MAKKTSFEPRTQNITPGHPLPYVISLDGVHHIHFEGSVVICVKAITFTSRMFFSTTVESSTFAHSASLLSGLLSFQQLRYPGLMEDNAVSRKSAKPNITMEVQNPFNSFLTRFFSLIIGHL